MCTCTANVSSVLVKINMVDINRQTKMYSQGMAPVYKVVPGKSQWDRIRDKPVFKVKVLMLVQHNVHFLYLPTFIV